MNQILSLRQARRLMDFDDNRTFEKWCRHNGVDIFCMENSNRRYVWELNFYTARDKNLRNQDGINLLQYSQALAFDWKDERSYSVHPLMDDNEKIIQIPKYLKLPGYYIKCNFCRTWLRDRCKETGKPIVMCPHNKDLKLLSVIEKIDETGKRTREVRILPTRDAFIGAQMHLVRQGKKLDADVIKNIHVQDSPATEKVNGSLLELMDLYCDFIEGKKSSKFRRKVKSKKHQQEIKRVFEDFKECAEENNVDLKLLSAEMLTESHVDLYCEKLEARSLSGRSFNKYVGIMKTFYKFLSKRKYVNRNPFDGIIQKDENAKREDTITQEKFEALLEAFKNRELGKQKFANSRRSVWRNYLGAISIYGLYSGRRLTELCFSKWQDVKCIDNVPSYIEFIDRKVTNQKNDPDAKPKIITVPMIPELRNFLEQAGLREKIGKDEFIIAPDGKEKRESMTHVVSSAFSHFYKQIDSDKPLTFHCLRRTYQTALTKAVGPELARLYGGHAQFSTMQNHYLNPKELLSEVKNTTIFGEKNENAREKELSKARQPKRNISLSK